MMRLFKCVWMCIVLWMMLTAECCAEQAFFVSKADVIDEQELRSGEFSEVWSYEVEQGHPLYTSIDGVLYSKDKKVLISYPAARAQKRYKIADTTQHIAAYAFAHSALEYIDLFAASYCQVTSIGDGAFLSCGQLKQMCIPKCVTKLGKNIFADTSDELLVVLEKNGFEAEMITEQVNTLWLEDMHDYHEWMRHNDQIWSYCDLYENESYEVIDECLFRHGILLAYPGLKCDSVYVVPEGTKQIESQILKNDYLEKIVIPASCEAINTTQGGKRFSCFEVNPLNPVYSAMDGVLYDKTCAALLVYPSKKRGDVFVVPDTVRKLEWECFSDCEYIKEIVLPSALESIDEFAFYNAASLRKINIPASVLCMYVDAFECCTALEEIVVEKNSYAEKAIREWSNYVDLTDSLVFTQ